jgi:hypothetical protein
MQHSNEQQQQQHSQQQDWPEERRWRRQRRPVPGTRAVVAALLVLGVGWGGPARVAAQGTIQITPVGEVIVTQTQSFNWTVTNAVPVIVGATTAQVMLAQVGQVSKPVNYGVTVTRKSPTSTVNVTSVFNFVNTGELANILQTANWLLVFVPGNSPFLPEVQTSN